VKVPF
jgi:hypothetical protein